MKLEAYQDMAANEEHHWWFTARRKILADFISRLYLPADPSILEIGCGTGGNLALLSSFGRVCAVEKNDTAIATALEKTACNVDIRQGDFPMDNPFAGRTFDLICMLDVLEHIEGDNSTLKTARAMLAPGGRILLTVPAYNWLWGAHDETLHHQRRYAARELRALAKGAGLLPEKLTYFSTFLFPLMAAVRILIRLTGDRKTRGTGMPAQPLNRILEGVFGSERYFLKTFDFPFGLSLLGIFKDNGS